MRDPSDDILGELREELRSVAPSPVFAAAVRARVNSETPASRGWLLFWMLGGGLAVAAAGALVAVGVWRSPARPQAPGAPAIQTAAVASTAPLTRASSPAAPKAAAATPRPRLSASAATPSAGSGGDRTLEVITNQREVIERVWAVAERRGVTAGLTRAETPPSEAPLVALTVDPIGVDPIVVEALPRADVPAAAGPVIRRVTLDTTRSER
jgi:hypothetical protein